ncbi:MAG: hypothetical protein ACRELB_19365, partial [Polyangiaceae bacterium]
MEVAGLRACAAIIGVASAIAGCGTHRVLTGGSPLDAIPERIAVPGGTLTAGFALGATRGSVQVET